MEYYSNAYQYLKQKKMLSYLEMKTSGDLSWTDKIDPGVSPTQALSPGMKSSEEMAVQEKLGKIRAKLQSGARLTGAEKEYQNTIPSFTVRLWLWKRKRRLTQSV